MMVELDQNILIVPLGLTLQTVGTDVMNCGTCHQMIL